MFTSETLLSSTFSFFFFNDTATTEIYTLSLHDALPICFIQQEIQGRAKACKNNLDPNCSLNQQQLGSKLRSEEHTSELQSHSDLVCRLLLEKKKKDGIETQHIEYT